MAVLSIDADQLGFIGDDEDPVACEPRRGDAGEIELPLTLTGDEVERDHSATLADGDHLPVVDHRVGVDVVEGRDAGADAGPLQRVLPNLAPVLIAIGVELARRKTGDDGALPDRRRSRAEHAGDLQAGGLRPVGRSVILFERIDLIVLAHHVDRAVGDGRRATQRSAGPNLPDDPAIALVERDHEAESVGRVHAALVIGEAAAVQGLLAAPLGRGLGRPQEGAGATVERADRAESVRHIDVAAGDDRRRGEPRGERAAAPGLHRECAREPGTERQLAHRLAGVAARLAPLGVGDRFGQAHRKSRRGRIDRHVILAAQHCDALPEHRRVGLLALLERRAAACSERCGNHEGDAQTFRSRHSWSYWAWLGSTVLMSTPNEAAS